MTEGVKPQRVASVISLGEGYAQEYERLHREVWPAVLATLRRAHMTNYSIFRYQDLLFSYLEYVGNDFEADSALIAADPDTQAWWRVVGPLQRSLRSSPDEPWWLPMPEVFHLP